MKYVKGPYEIKLYYYIKKQDPNRKIGFLIFYLPFSSLKKFLDPFIGQKYNSSAYRLHGTQNDRLELTVSTQKSDLKNMQRVPRYWPKRLKICRFGLATQNLISQDPVHIFQNRFLRCNRELKPVILTTMKPINGTNLRLSYKGVQIKL